MKVVLSDIEPIYLFPKSGVMPFAHAFGTSICVTDYYMTYYRSEHRHALRKALENGDITVQSFSDSQTMELEKFYRQFGQGLTITDASTLYYASITGSVIISDEKIIKQKGQLLGIRVRPFAWVVNSILLESFASNLDVNIKWIEESK